MEAQIAPVFAIGTVDFNEDGKPDLFLGGNISHSRLRFGRSDANYGVLLENQGGGSFRYIRQAESGFNLQGDVRSVLWLDRRLLIGFNEQPLRVFTGRKAPAR